MSTVVSPCCGSTTSVGNGPGSAEDGLEVQQEQCSRDWCHRCGSSQEESEHVELKEIEGSELKEIEGSEQLEGQQLKQIEGSFNRILNIYISAIPAFLLLISSHPLADPLSMRWKWRFVQSHSNLEHGRGSRVWSQKIL